jgi:hypothetical protein
MAASSGRLMPGASVEAKVRQPTLQLSGSKRLFYIKNN